MWHLFDILAHYLNHLHSSLARGQGGVKGYTWPSMPHTPVPIAHVACLVPQYPCTILPHMPIPLYPTCTLLLHVAHSPCTHCPCVLYPIPLYHIAPYAPIAHTPCTLLPQVAHTPCTHYPCGPYPIPPVPHYPYGLYPLYPIPLLCYCPMCPIAHVPHHSCPPLGNGPHG